MLPRLTCHTFFKLTLLLGFFFLIFSISSVSAQTEDDADSSDSLSQESTEATLGVAQMMQIVGEDIKDGYVISSSSEGPTPSTVAYDPQVLGIVARDAAIILNNTTEENGIPVISQGTVYVLVSSAEGPIAQGDLLTTSTNPGVAVKAVQDGYVLGRALQDYDNPDPEHIDKIAMSLNLHYYSAKPTLAGSLTDILKIALNTTDGVPSPWIKYIVAAIVVIGSFVLGYLTFGRTAAKGVEALGRNPAASKIIHLGIILNVSIVVVIVLVGLVVAFLILRL